MRMELKLQMKVWPLLLPPCKRFKNRKTINYYWSKRKKNWWKGEVSPKARVVI